MEFVRSISSINDSCGTCVVAIDELKDRSPRMWRSIANRPMPWPYQTRILPVTGAQREANIHEHYGVCKLLYSHLTCVDVSMRGKGLGSRLATAAMELGRSKGYPLMTAFCTSFYSARQKEALGMECIFSLKYEDYKGTKGKVIFTPPEPHKEVRVLAIKL